MDRDVIVKRVILISIIVIFCFSCFLLYFLIEYNMSENSNPNVLVTTAEGETKETIPEVIEKYESEYLEEDNGNIYVFFSKDLYDEDGRSNEKFFASLVKELEKFFENKDFYLIDTNYEIKIYAKYDKDQEKHIMIINDVNDYYDNTNGKTYNEVNNVKYAKECTTIRTTCSLLQKLENNGMRINTIEEDIGEGTDIGRGYTSYLDGKVKLRKVKKNMVRNIVISKNYEEKIFDNFDNDATLDEIVDENPDYCFGSVEENCLGYRTDNVYFFIYDDEVSMYGYSYTNNKYFEKSLSNYLKDRDFETFINLIIGQLPTYDYCEYDMETKSANIMYSSYGIEINIKDNDPTGINLYSNYCFTDETKQFVKDGLITFKNDENSIENIEMKRRLGA